MVDKNKLISTYKDTRFIGCLYTADGLENTNYITIGLYKWSIVILTPNLISANEITSQNGIKQSIPVKKEYGIGYYNRKFYVLYGFMSYLAGQLYKPPKAKVWNF